MSLVIKANHTATDKLTCTLTIQEQTGDFDADLNPGGWGVDNPAREDYAVLLYVSAKGNWQVIPGEAPGPDGHRYVIPEDGMYYFRLAAVPKLSLDLDTFFSQPHGLSDGQDFYHAPTATVYRVNLVVQTLTPVTGQLAPNTRLSNEVLFFSTLYLEKRMIGYLDTDMERREPVRRNRQIYQRLERAHNYIHYLYKAGTPLEAERILQQLKSIQ